MAARAVQEARFLHSKTRCNAQMTTREVRQHCALSDAGTNLLRKGVLTQQKRKLLQHPEKQVSPVRIQC